MANRAEAGFTLVEVLAAVVVLAIAIGSIMLAFSNGMGMVWRTGARNHALHAAEGQIAEKIAAGTGSTDDQIVIRFPGMDGITVSGRTEPVTANVRGHSFTIHAFIPRKGGSLP
ncbi:MAG: prepilin-type N-terminal cleavage/methylation domain-containing protein [Bacillota bacterium]